MKITTVQELLDQQERGENIYASGVRYPEVTIAAATTVTSEEGVGDAVLFGIRLTDGRELVMALEASDIEVIVEELLVCQTLNNMGATK